VSLSADVAVGKLAPGMRLPREVVAQSQRERLMLALIDVVDRQGFPATTVAHLVARSRVSRGAFYEHFKSVEDCFAAAYDLQIARGHARLLSAYNAPGLGGEQRARAAIDAWESFARSSPAATRVCLSDVLSVRRGSIEYRDRARVSARALLDGVLGDEGPHDEQILTALETAAIGAVRRATVALVEDGAAREPGLLADGLLGWLACYRDAAPARAAHVPSRSRRESQNVPAGAFDEAEDPRTRILRAVLEICARKGYAAMTHRDIAAAASVSYSTFYKHFDGKQQALLSACDELSATLNATIALALPAGQDWPSMVRDALTLYLRLVARDPGAARVAAIETLPLGRAGLHFRERRAHSLRQMLAPGLAAHPHTHPILPDVLSGAIIELVHDHALHNRIERLPALAPTVVYIVLAPFVGAEQAARLASEPSDV
jgi:AcrR family transcriptional regulator